MSGIIRTGRLRGLLLLAVLPSLGIQPTPSSTFRVAIQPLGNIEPRLLREVIEGISATYNADITVLPVAKLPQEAYYPQRSRYRADKLLDYLDRTTSPDYVRVIGITDKDISITKGDVVDWGIFGFAYLSRRPCVVSTFRLRRDGPVHALLIARLTKVINHELGHTLGLSHCPNAGCLMEDIKGSIKTVDGWTGGFCPSCEAGLTPQLRLGSGAGTM